MKNLMLYLFCFLSVFNCYGQKNNATSSESFSFAGVKPTQNSVMYGFDNTPVELEGSVYADSTWSIGSLYLYSKGNKNQFDTISNLLIRYDTHKSEIDILHSNKILVADAQLTYGFAYVEKKNLKTHTFINISHYENQLSGFVELLSTGKINLLKYYYTEIKNPDFNPVLNVGSKNFKVLQKTNIYYSNGSILQKIEYGKISKFCEKMFNEKKLLIEEYTKNNNLNIRKESDLTQIFNYHNQIEPYIK